MAKHKDLGRIIALWNKVGGDAGVAKILDGKTKVVHVGGTVLTIDRSVAPTYPSWVDLTWNEHEKYSVLGTGLSTIDLMTTILYLHPSQKNGGRIGGTELYEFLKSTGLIEHCLDLRFGEELVKQPHLFPAAWKGKYLPLWKSVTLHRGGSLDMPVVCEVEGKVYVHWVWLGRDHYDVHPAVLSAS